MIRRIARRLGIGRMLGVVRPLGFARVLGRAGAPARRPESALFARLAAVNLAGLALLGGAAARGWITEVWHGDSSRLSVAIAALFLVGLGFSLKSGVALRTLRWIASALVMLGLIGTVVGFIEALLGVNATTAGDPAAIAPMVAALVSGMGTALYTTLIGATLNLWLLLNVRIIEAHRGT